MNELHLRSVTPDKLALESLISLAISGLYSDELVSEQLGPKDFFHFPAEDTYPKISNDHYLSIRTQIKELQDIAIRQSTKNGSFNESNAKALFDKLLYQNIRTILPITEYEASQVGIWDYLTVRVLLDVAIWRFNTEVIKDRFVGLNRARHVFARWWFRRGIADSSAALQNYSLLETEWETVFERQSLCWDPGVANACLRVLQDCKGRAPEGYKTKYVGAPNKIWIKRIMRLTSQSTFNAFHEDDLYEKFWALHPFNEHYD